MRLPRPPIFLTNLLRRRGGKWVVACAAVATVAIVGFAGWKILRRSDRTPHASLTALPAGPSKQSDRPTRIIAFSEGCSTSECHAAFHGAPLVASPIAHARCEQCHAPDTTGTHVYPVLKSTAAACTNCHVDLVGSHHATGSAGSGGGGHVNDCLNCHAPHATANRFMLVGKPGESACVSCHPTADGRVRHSSYTKGACAACHDAHSPLANHDTPQTAAASCAECHAPAAAAVMLGSKPHGNLTDACLSCHAPHASDHKGLLTAAPAQLCVSCHEDIRSAAAGATIPHGAMLTAEGCLACHDPHSGRTGGMLWSDQTTLCLSCHGKTLKATDGRPIPEMATVMTKSAVKHGPISIGLCGACHAVHGGTHPALLKHAFAKVPQGKFDLANYALCFSCHDRELVLGDGPGATGFRDGTKNLHLVHVKNGDRSSGCATCHEVHGGDHPRLIVNAANYENSDWKPPMKFLISPQGGSCAPGCHAPMSYTRDRAAAPRPPEPAPTKRGAP